MVEVIIVGGSVGGLSAAHALRQAGCIVRVLEKSARISNPTGAVSADMISLHQALQHCHFNVAAQADWLNMQQLPARPHTSARHGSLVDTDSVVASTYGIKGVLNICGVC